MNCPCGRMCSLGVSYGQLCSFTRPLCLWFRYFWEDAFHFGWPKVVFDYFMFWINVFEITISVLVLDFHLSSHSSLSLSLSLSPTLISLINETFFWPNDFKLMIIALYLSLPPSFSILHAKGRRQNGKIKSGDCYLPIRILSQLTGQEITQSVSE